MEEKDFFYTDHITKSERYLHTPGKFAKENLLYVQEIGKLKSLIPHKCIRDDLDSFLILVVMSGKGTLVVKDKCYEMMAEDCAFVNCKEHYEHISDEEEGWELFWVHFSGYIAKGYYMLFEQYAKDTHVFRMVRSDAFIKDMEILMANQKRKDLMAELQSGSLLIQLTNYVIESVIDDSVNNLDEEHNQIVTMREFINENYADQNVLKRFTDQFGEWEEEANEKFQSFFGISLEEYVWNRRFNAAKELLRFSVKPMQEVSTETGIGDVNLMKNMFQKEENLTPEEYRMKWAQWIRK